MKNRLVFVGFALFGMAIGGVAGAQLAGTAAAATQGPAQATDARIRAAIVVMQTKLAKPISGDPDRAYVSAMAAITPAVIAMCRDEIAYGKKAAVKTEALRILTAEQEYDARTQELEREFYIMHN